MMRPFAIGALAGVALAPALTWIYLRWLTEVI